MSTVSIDNFCWRYSTGDWVLQEINLEIQAGERVGVVGRSGSGKSTLALLLNGIIPKSVAGGFMGQVVVCGRDTADTPVSEMAHMVAMVFQSPDDQMTQLRVCHEIQSGPANLRLPVQEVLSRAEQAAQTLGITHLWNRETSTLSGGEKQKVALAAALAMGPKLLVLDEPTTDLDPRSKADIIKVLAHLPKETTIVIVSHDLEAISPLVNRLVVVDGGQIMADGKASELLDNPSLLVEHGIALPQLIALRQLLPAERRWPVFADAQSVASYLQGWRESQPELPHPNGVVHQEEVIRLERVSYAYHGSHKPAVADVSLSVKRGEIVAIVGNNGSGKTTLSKLILGLLKPSSGNVSMHGERVQRIRPERVGYIYQNPDGMLTTMSVAEEVGLTPKILGMADWHERATDMLARFSLTELAHKYPLALSKGQRQRLAYAAVAAAHPPVYIFDEPTTGIDKPGCDEIMRYMDELRRRGCTILFVTHDMPLALRWADRVVVMSEGQVVQSTTPNSLAALDPYLLEMCGLHMPPIVQVSKLLGLGQLPTTPDQLVPYLRKEVFA